MSLWVLFPELGEILLNRRKHCRDWWHTFCGTNCCKFMANWCQISPESFAASLSKLVFRFNHISEQKLLGRFARSTGVPLLNGLPPFDLTARSWGRFPLSVHSWIPVKLCFKIALPQVLYWRLCCWFQRLELVFQVRVIFCSRALNNQCDVHDTSTVQSWLQHFRTLFCATKTTDLFLCCLHPQIFLSSLLIGKAKSFLL